MEVYLTSDLHFGHKNIIKYENRNYDSVEEMDIDYIKKWNETVKPEDFIYILGDFSWHKSDKTTEILKQLNGKKVLIVGNHDEIYLKDKNFDTNLFEEICYYKELKINKTKIILFHYPIIDWNGKHNGSIHFYGHVHSIINKDTEYMKKENNCYNVSMDYNNKFLKLEDFIQKGDKNGL